mmetsp:Transcript_39556/g.64109  ORF Transcript_39556/g.64109 Transcript_39556/m.64109 type:complete len:271 (-) Transcript_39556:1077-1889(-)
MMLLSYNVLIAIERIVEWSRDLTEWGHVWLSFDVTFDHGIDDFRSTLDRCLKDAGLEKDAVRVHTYSQEDMLLHYPILQVVSNRCKRLRGGGRLRKRKISLAWGFHAEAINVWYQSLREGYEYVWVLEDDVGFSGKLSELFQAYSTVESDLITDSLERTGSRWYWYETCSVRYTALVGKERYKAKEHVQRFSRALLNELDRMSRRKVCAWSEASVPTLCLHAGLEVSKFEKGHISSHFDWDKKVCEKSWRRWNEGRSPRPKNKFYHALKF